MRQNGPNSPCTELHCSPSPGRGLGTVIKLWNLVFMQHDGVISWHLRPLTARHLDTGMAMGRITAVRADMWKRITMVLTPDLTLCNQDNLKFFRDFSNPD